MLGGSRISYVKAGKYARRKYSCFSLNFVVCQENLVKSEHLKKEPENIYFVSSDGFTR
jgi:hypothetical protein